MIAIAIAFGIGTASAEPWRFGIISDTQWTVEDDGSNPNEVAAGIIRQVDREFIRHGVKFVVAVGDLADAGKDINLDTRALYAQDLYNAGIGFYPLRGNHDAGAPGSGREFARVFPQIRDGVNNATPEDVLTSGVGHDTNIDPSPKTGSTFRAGANFSRPTEVNQANVAETYSFDFGNARLILIDQFAGEEKARGSTVAQQLPWITSRLSDPKRPEHAFVFGHKNLLGGNHKDNLFGNHAKTDPGDEDEAQWPTQNAFLAAMAENGARLYIGGHDHHHYHSIVTSPDGNSRVHQLITQSDSSKFYVPKLPVSKKDAPISQDLDKIGYYIGTIDGPLVTIDYFGVPVDGKLAKTPTLTGRWQKVMTFGFGLNGKEFQVPQGGSLTQVSDDTSRAIAGGGGGYARTAMRILSGTNSDKGATNYGKPLLKAVNTGWSPKTSATLSDILSLWGLGGTAADTVDTFTLSISYDPKAASPADIKSGAIGIVSREPGGDRWTKAVGTNDGGTKKFVFGPWKAEHGLGSYGIDVATHTAWAVINRNLGQYAIARQDPATK